MTPQDDEQPDREEAPPTWPDLPPPPGGQGPWWAEPASSQPTAWGQGLPASAAGLPPRRGRAWLAAVVAALVLVSGGIGIGWVLTRGGGTPSTGTEAPLKTVPPDGSSNGQSTRELTQQAIANLVDPAVVDVNTVIDGFGLGDRGAAK